MELEAQIVKGELKLPRDIDQQTRDLLQCIFSVDPNMRISINEVMKKSYFKETNWEQVRAKKFDPDDVPYKPNPNKYRYLLQNKYPEMTNLDSSQAPPGGPQAPGAQPPNSEALFSSPKKSLLGDFTILKVNKEFDNF
uniref:Uncharacterized protein n=1 Tax=Strombidium rassoulzadegani TaxID=1082188 RepID=A0A7S3CPC5_9SPIT|mmetsp:Transcript_1934/g.3348  ORF Transcript_1934/g.3348 Transcript_1934/m.3348 type:complete len:138 (+) Transcript_1934:354-767(+)